MKLYLVTVNRPIEESDFRMLLEFAGAEKRTRILKQKVIQNAYNMLVGELLAKAMIKKMFGIDFEKQKFADSGHGKPYLPDFPDIHFNISHSGELVVCAVSEKPVGVDVQKISKFRPKVADRVCNETELRQIENSMDRASEFTRLWTEKEAVLKLNGTGIFGGNLKHCLEHHSATSRKIGDFWLAYAVESSLAFPEEVIVQTFDLENFIQYVKHL